MRSINRGTKKKKKEPEFRLLKTFEEAKKYFSRNPDRRNGAQRTFERIDERKEKP
jgi:hypothetical protein